MVDVGTDLEFAAITIGFVSTSIVIVTQLFGTGGVLDFGWSTRVKTVARLRSTYDGFDALFKKMSATRPHGTAERVLYFSTAFIPIFFSLGVTYLVPRADDNLVVLGLVLVLGISFWLVSDVVASRAGQLRTGQLPLTEPQRVRLHRLRFLEGRMVLGWLNPPIYLLSAAATILFGSPSTSDLDLALVGIAAVILLTLLFGRSAIRALMELEGAVFSDFLSESHASISARVSLRDAAGGHSTVEGSLTGLAELCAIRDDKGFDEWIPWHHIGRVSFKSSSNPHQPPPTSPEGS